MALEGGVNAVSTVDETADVALVNALQDISSGAPGGIRTPGLRIRSPLLYPAELLALMCTR